MRQLMVTAISAALIAITPPAEANHRPNTYCSETGDICQSTRKVNGLRKLRIRLAARYFDWYQLCVLKHHEAEVCANFEIEKSRHRYGDNVRWKRVFPNYEPGHYTVTWRLMLGERVGRKLGFHVPRSRGPRTRTSRPRLLSGANSPETLALLSAWYGSDIRNRRRIERRPPEQSYEPNYILGETSPSTE